jgi:hypothetical protein
MKSKATSTVVEPAGTSQRIVNMSASSRFQASAPPPVRITRPTTSVTGPVGPCSPGIHFGYRRVSVPGFAGTDRWT